MMPGMATVILTPAAQQEALDLPRPIQARLTEIMQRLEGWPQVSGAKALRGELAGSWRIRTGDYRVRFVVSPDEKTVTITKVGHRRDVYDD